MTVFQYLAISLLMGLVVLELLRSRRHFGARGFRLVRCLVWLLAAVAIARPDWVQDAGTLLGIGRGSDLVLYFFVLAFLATSFYFYSRYVRLQRQVTQLMRHLALQEARRGPEPQVERSDTTGLTTV